MDAVVKVGGSLAQIPEILRVLCNKLSEYALEYKLIIVPGGGRFADVVRDFDHDFTLSRKTSHKMAILGMDQYAMLLADIMPGSHLVRTFNEMESLSEVKETQILLPSPIMFEENPLENSWDVTSDSITAYLAGRLGTPKVILITNVDGIFTNNPEDHSGVKLIRKTSAENLLLQSRRTSIDRFLPRLLLKYALHCYVVNGRYPERIKSILAGKRTTCTQISPFSSKHTFFAASE
jgi:5-(aminomethyl)-3-furanmethanol phosphate kinase